MTVAITQDGFWIGRLPAAIKKSDTKQKFVSVRIDALLDDSGISGYMAQLEESLQDEQALQERTLAIGLQTGQIAHDLKNIFQALNAYIDLTTQLLPTIPNPKVPAKQMEQNLQRTLLRGKHLCERLSQATSRQTTTATALNLNDIITEESSLFTQFFRNHGIDYTQELCDIPLKIYADPMLMSQIFSNLMINAQQAIYPAKGKITISTEQAYMPKYLIPGSSAKEGFYAIANIEDSGCGISTENLLRLFEPRFTTKETGSGFGLSTTYAIVKQNGGFINVKSKEKEGSKFTVALPIYKE